MSNNFRRRRRSARACEACRKRKIKCDGSRPVCGQCVDHKRCKYEDVKRVRDQKMLDILAHRVERYETLLRDLEGEVDASTALNVSEVEPDQSSILSFVSTFQYDFRER
ncbi:hypothetical protein N7530_008812 [Penicillium desertorum]|uniref:Zn(2)-C6 fungal-type domain-containing protein n=1 Tax=Penicillium desertorum TaxID=1303715 RepID=A0A9X0BL87_9EURO|nr:hypothetical protein N7530_008812 [Penicillium desertorum]